MIDLIIIGAGQAGLTMGYYLKQEGYNFLLLEAGKQVGDSWRNRYDSLQLFTPRSYSSLPGMALIGEKNEFPYKDEIATYLEEYARHFQLPVQLQTEVLKIKKEKEIFELHTPTEVLQTKKVIIASGGFQQPFIPSVSANLSSHIFQIHSSQYKSSPQIPQGKVLVVGGGNSGMQIAVELAKTHEVTVSISHPLTFLPLQLFGKSIFNLLEKVGLLYAEINTKRGRWFQKRKDPIFGFEGKKLIRNGAIKLQEKVVSASGNNIMFQNGDIYSAESVIWSTGFVQNYNWIEIEQAVTEKGFPNHIKGISPVKGLYYIGLPWQSQRGSALICGVGKDAAYVLSEIKKIDQ
ncbi:NAD(P)/FAD-dependent oxidoreductase [Bacillus cereus]|uniref:Oxidoreductase n=1 Tax=Bacillus cereus TaxID=1396 RepID=A0A9X7LXB2_BACCE|nr:MULTISPECIES: NAD(P)/FAD-dependent oxidoreductase [Bacillus]WIV91102.1 NAD(P)/FAD-dependent oxidoreductase [Bacillus bombysepticus]KXH89299.1 oxidoreductase [Bacillus sp. JH7]MDF9651284.1 NAD(P)/FAD-dependent oxidoreductase [Bacillus cereus]MDZ4522378.1 NAD(P)/FAD-dependent oxidoreductase [Bacillus cereus]QDZ74586.1 oxidoreductase [Bacillus cereus]